MHKLKLHSEEEKKDIHDNYQRIINDYQEKIQVNEKYMNSAINEVTGRDRFTIEKLQNDLNSKTKQLDFHEQIIKTLKAEFKPFYDKYIRTHNRSFDSKQGETRYIMHV